MPNPGLPPRRTRSEAPFTWHVNCGMPTYAVLGDVRFDRIFRELDAIVEAFTKGESKARELYGPDVRYGGPIWSAISYGHVNCLGAELTFPEDSLNDLRLDTFDPGVSPRLKATDLRDRCSVPFLWRLNGMRVRDFSCDEVRRYVFEGTADGASGVFCTISRTMTTPDAVRKIHTFISAAKQAERLLSEGCPRDRLREHI